MRNGLPTVCCSIRIFADCSEQSRLIVPQSVSDLFILFIGFAGAAVERE
jgi:hypothetical protein